MSASPSHDRPASAKRPESAEAALRSASGSKPKPKHGPDEIGKSRWARLERLADRFEQTWDAGQGRGIEEALGAAPRQDRLELLHVLIGLDAERRRIAGVAVEAKDYLGRFDHLLTVRSARDGSLTPGAGAAPTEEEVRYLIAPHIPTTICPHDQTLDDRAQRDAAIRSSRLAERPPALPPHLKIEPSYGNSGLLGRGGMGAVWAARDLREVHIEGRSSRGRIVAVKALLPGAAADSQLLSRFAREAAILHAFGDPAVPRFYEYRPPTRHEDAHIITDLIVGETFERLLDSRRRLGRAGCDALGTGNGRLRMFRKIVQTVARAHARGVIHRDIKPSNMMVRVADAKGRRRVFLLDFGMACMSGLPADPCDEHGRLIADSFDVDALMEDWTLTQTSDGRLHAPAVSQTETDNVGFTVIMDETSAEPSVTEADQTFMLRSAALADSADFVLPPAPQSRPLGATRLLDGRTAPRTLIGSLPYMAPEQARRRRVGPTADVYSLGLILVEILTGEQARDVTEADAVIEKARKGDIATAIDRLDHCAARHELIELALRCVRYDPRTRPADAGELLGELDALSVKDPVSRSRAWDPRTVARSRGRRQFRAATQAISDSSADGPAATSPRTWIHAAAETVFGSSKR
ncbi:serine/threonine-protein kinase [Alienimonas chondri]|uniref:serine/threonine-protein kinase n=1 Tax=Alienimonas chondri TaxID=2681879 RepID=UPI001488F6A6|nr:serine/threonine-protein kinase [Alienimonas chondri]